VLNRCGVIVAGVARRAPEREGRVDVRLPDSRGRQGWRERGNLTEGVELASELSSRGWLRCGC
jgi:hypothetical protein